MKKISGIVYLNGEFYQWDEAKIPIFDHGFLYGDGVFDSLVVKNGKVFKLDEHVRRFYDSAKMIKIEIPLETEQFKDIVLKTIKMSGLRDAYLKVFVTRGKGYPLMDAPCERPTIIVAVQEISEIVAKGQKRGVKAKTVSIRKIPPVCLDPRIKALPYLNHILARNEAKEAGADEAILLDIYGFVAEGPAENIFAVKGSTLITPPPINILDGITRRTIIEMAERESYKVVERAMTLYDLYTADEVFLTSTWGGVIPVTEIDGQTIKDGKIGLTTKRLMELHTRILKEEGTEVF